MEIVFLLTGLAVGAVVGHFVSARKAAALDAQVKMQQAHAQDMLKAEQEKTAVLSEREKQEKEMLRKQLDAALQKLTEARQAEASLQTDKGTTERSLTRIELMLLIQHDPANTFEIEKVARHYFVDLGGNWYMAALYSDWAATYGGDTSFVKE